MEAVDRYPDFLTLKQIRKLESWGADFGLHSYSHFSYKELSRMKPEERRTFIEKDTIKAEKRFFRLLGEIPLVYAYPYGEYGDDLIEVLKRHGFVAAFAQDLGAVCNCTDPYIIPRIPVVGGWSGMKRFLRHIRLRGLCVKGMKYGIVNNPLELSLSIGGSYDRCWLYHTGEGWRSVPASGSFSEKICVGSGRERVGIRCVKNGTAYEALWFVTSGGGSCR